MAQLYMYSNMLTTKGKPDFIGHASHRIQCWFSSNPSSKVLHLDHRYTSKSIPSKEQTTVVVEVDQTIPTFSSSRVFPSHKPLIEIADGVVWLCCRDTNRHRRLPHLSKTLGLHLVPEIGKTKVRPLGKEEEVMGNGDGYLDHRTSWIRLHPTDEDLCHGSPLEDAWKFPIHGIEWCVG